MHGALESSTLRQCLGYKEGNGIRAECAMAGQQGRQQQKHLAPTQDVKMQPPPPPQQQRQEQRERQQ